MSFGNRLRSIFHPAAKPGDAGIDAAFAYLLSLVRDPELIKRYTSEIEDAKYTRGAGRIAALARTQSHITESIISDTSTSIGGFTENSLRASVRQHVDIESLPTGFRLLF